MEVTFAYNREETIRGLLNRQKELDTGDTILEGQSVADILAQLCDTCAIVGDTTSYLGVNIY